MSQGKGALGDRNSAVGSSGAQYGASPIKSFPSAPSPCSKMTRRLGLPPAAGGREGPDSAGIIGAASRKPSSSWYRYLRSAPAVTRSGEGDDIRSYGNAVCTEPDGLPASRSRPLGARRVAGGTG